MNQIPIFFITGTSGSGKSTLIQLLKHKLSEKKFSIHDFDESMVFHQTLIKHGASKQQLTGLNGQKQMLLNKE